MRTFGSVETAEITGGITIGLKLVLTFIGVLTLAIGGVGVMNIMFVSVTERTREIGIRKALGARRRDILLQFLLEGLVITFVGGRGRRGRRRGCSCGCSARGRSSPSCSTTCSRGRPTSTWCCRWSCWRSAAAILMVVGLVAGFLPALRASRLDPIESLRYE